MNNATPKMQFIRTTRKMHASAAVRNICQISLTRIRCCAWLKARARSSGVVRNVSRLRLHDERRSTHRFIPFSGRNIVFMVGEM